MREFDLVDLRFVDGGFALPEANTDVAWRDIDHLCVGTDFGPGSLTDSGYPRLVKLWRRGQPLADATTVFEGESGDVAASVSVDRTPCFERTLFERSIDFYRMRLWLLDGAAMDPVPKPDDASLAFWREHVSIELRSDWALPGTTWPRGSLLVADARAFIRGGRGLAPVFTPNATRSLAGWSATPHDVAAERARQRRQPA